MAVQLIKSPQIAYTPVNRGFISRSNFRSNVVSFDRSRESASKAAFNASLQRAQVSQQYWNDLLEKLRKGGGGGGGGSRFDRVTVSMQVMDFITKKMIAAMMQSLKSGSLQTEPHSIDQINNEVTNLKFIQSITSNISKAITFIIGRDLPLASLVNQMTKNLTKSAEGIMISFSAQINKFKELMEKDLKDILEKLNIKGKLKKVQTILFDFFVEMKEEIKNTINLIKNFLNLSFAAENAKIYPVKR